MTVRIQGTYTLPGGDQPLTHARIAHSGNWFAGGTITASSTNANYFADAPDNSLTYERWKPSAALPETWETDLGASQECDYCCVAAHDMGSLGLECQPFYRDGGAWISACGKATPLDDSPIYFLFEPVTAPEWRLTITAGSGSSLPTIGVIRFGMALQMPRPIYGGHVPIDFAKTTILRSNRSETGEFLGRTKQRSYRETEYAWQHISRSWFDANWTDAQTAVESEPFFVAWRPELETGVAYGVTDTVPVPQNMGLVDLLSVNLKHRARGYD